MQEEMSELDKQEWVFGVRSESSVLEDWNEARATSLAKDEGIELTDAHWEVIRFLRRHYETHGPVKHARQLSQALEETFGAQGGLKYLYTLLPQGPVAQGCRLAGLPAPKDSINVSFGSAS